MKNTLLILLAFLAACSTSGTSIPIGKTVYPSVPPESVYLLLESPKEPHEIIAVVEGVAATDDYFTKKRTETAALDAMKKEAARLGADAIILENKSTKPYGNVVVSNSSASAYNLAGNISAYGTATAYGLGWEKITFSGFAIKIKKE